MVYLSQLLGTPIYSGTTRFGKVIDFGVQEMQASTAVSTLLIKRNHKKEIVPIDAVTFDANKFHLTDTHIIPQSYDTGGFYLVEDLLDKQVIDVSGRRLVRVNDVVLEQNGELKVTGIDIGFSGVLRRLGVPGLLPLRNITVPWSVIEAFDYETGDIRLKLGKHSLNTLHPAELADIIEEAGIKERVGLVEVLDAQKAADVLEEADNETSQSVLESLPKSQLKSVISKMHIAEIADALDGLNAFRVKEIFKLLTKEQSQHVRKLLVYADDVAGGLMSPNYFAVTAEKTVGEVLAEIRREKKDTEEILIVDKNGKVRGSVQVKAFLQCPDEMPMRKLMHPTQHVHEEATLPEILKLFSNYNLRILPVVDELKHIVGVIPIDVVLSRLQEDEEEEDAL